MRYVVALTLALLTPGCADSGPSETVEQFFDLMEPEWDAQATYNMVIGIERDDFLIDMTGWLVEIDDRGGLSAVTVLSEDMDGMTAEVEVIMIFGNGETEELPTDLVRVDGQWKIRYD